MGLDMYLYTEEYVSPNFDEKRYEQMRTATGRDNIELLSYLELRWRNANHIHDWFVHFAQGGQNNCLKHWVSRDQLKELMLTCQAVVGQRDEKVSSRLLPSTKYDDGYYEQTEYTYRGLKDLLDNDDEDLEYYYDSSW